MFGGRFSSSIGYLGVDISSRSIRLLQLQQNGTDLTVVGAAEEPVPTEEMTDSVVEAFAQRLRAAFTSGGFTGSKCVVSLPRSDVHMQSVRLPKMPDHELKQAAAWEASQRFGFDRDAMEVDYIRTGATLQSSEGREEFLIIAATHSSINARLKPLLAAGYRPVSIDTNFAAVARIFSRQFRRESDRQHVRAIVEVGTSGATVMILRGDQIAFCKSLDISGRAFDEAVAEHLQMDLTAASELRAARIRARLSGDHDELGADDSTERAVYDAVRPVIGSLVKEITLCLRYFGVTFRGKPPSQIIVTGGDGLEPRLGEAIESGCKIPVHFDDSQGTMKALGEHIPKALNRGGGPAAAWSTAAGLSIRGLATARVWSRETSEAPARRGAA